MRRWTGQRQPDKRVCGPTVDPAPPSALTDRTTCPHPGCDWWVQAGIEGQEQTLLHLHTREAHPMTAERRYTLTEARQVIARETCTQYGHDLTETIIRDGTHRAIRSTGIRCTRCHATFTETPEPTQ